MYTSVRVRGSVLISHMSKSVGEALEGSFSQKMYMYMLTSLS